MENDIRWQQRFQNFDRAFVLLRTALEDNDIKQLNDLEQGGVIQRFEYSFELAWKTMKDYLEGDGIVISPVTPRSVIKAAFAAGVIDQGQIWIDMMLHRNVLAHTYDFSRFQEVLEAIAEKYLKEFSGLHEWFMERKLNP